MKNPFVSVIIPNYNHAKYLDQRIQSILNQTYKNFEVLILDDKSTDNSREVIEKYRNNSHISSIIYNENNSGSTFIQWNKGFETAKGEYIWIAESDDFCENSFLEILINYINNNSNIVIAASTSQFVDKNGVKLPPILKETKTRTIEGKKFISSYMTAGNYINNASSAIFKKTTLQNISREYMNFKAAGDRLFWIEIANQGDVCILGKPLNYFRQHQEKVSPQKSYDGTVFKEDFLIYNFLKSKGFINATNDFFIRNHYISLIHCTDFKNESIRINLLSLWGKNLLNNFYFSSFIDRFYQKYQSIKRKV